MTPLGLRRSSGFGAAWPSHLRGPDPDVPQNDPQAHRVGAAVTNMPMAMAEYLMNIPKRAIQAAGAVSEPVMSSDYDPRIAATDVAGEIATMLMGGGAARQFAKGAGAGELGIFGGRMGAETLAKSGRPAAQEAIALAETMEAAGASADDIWQATSRLVAEKDPSLGAGVARGADGEWRFEIDDSAAALTERVAGQLDAAAAGKTLPYEYAERTLSHPNLHEIYTLPNVQMTKGGGYPYRPSAQHRVRESGLEEIGIDAARQDQATPLALHEFQHSIQMREGFDRGFDAIDGDLSAYRDEIWAEATKANKQGVPLGDALARAEARKRAELYERVSGEVEAKNVESRRTMTPAERRASPPWATEDVPRSQQIIRRK